MRFKKKYVKAESKMEKVMGKNVKYIYNVVKQDCDGLDSVYEDYLIHLVGTYGVNLLKGNGLLESRGVIDGRQLYVIVEAKE